MGSNNLGALTAKIGQYLGRSKSDVSHVSFSEMSDNQSDLAGPNVTSSSSTETNTGHGLPEDAVEKLSGPDQVASLFSSVQNQAIDLQCQLAKATSDWTLALDLLTGRTAALEPLLNGALKVSKEREGVIEELTASNKEYKYKLADLDRELIHYRPMALQLDEDLRIAKDQLEKSARRMRDLEAENTRAIGDYNDLYRKLATAETVNQRLGEDNVAYSQKLNENDVTIQTLLRNTAQLRSDLVSASADRERAENESGEFANKLTAANEELKKTQVSLDSVKLQMHALKKESATQVKEAEERERQALETLVAKDKQIYDLETKLAGVNSKNEFLDRMVLRLRDELRRHLDHIGTLESSNRQLLETLSRNSAATALEGDLAERQQAQRGTTRLRTVHE
jgi:chromosome segregation ATPase